METHFFLCAKGMIKGSRKEAVEAVGGENKGVFKDLSCVNLGVKGGLLGFPGALRRTKVLGVLGFLPLPWCRGA